MAPPELTNAWLAEQVLGWYRWARISALPEIKYPFFTERDDGLVFVVLRSNAGERMFDPLYNPVDALRVWEQIRCRSIMLKHGDIYSLGLEEDALADDWFDGTFCLAICRAAQAWVLAQEGEHGDI